MLGLATTEKEGDSGKLVFVENDSAQFLITAFLQNRAIPIKKTSLDVLDDLKVYISDGLEEDLVAAFNGKFEDVVPKEALAYLNNKRKAEEKLEKESHAKKEKESKAAALLQKQKKLLDANAQKVAAAKASNEAAGSGDENEEASEEAATQDENLPDHTTDPFAVFKFAYRTVEIVAQDEHPEVNGRARKLTLQQQAAKMSKGISKTICQLDGDKVVVKFTEPGSLWIKAVTARLANVVNAVTCFATEHSTMFEACNTAPSNRLSIKMSRVVLAIMLHVEAMDSDFEHIGLHANFYEKNFQFDLNHTKRYWQPSFLKFNMVQLQGLYELVCNDNEDFNGTTAGQRKDVFIGTIEKRQVMPVEKSKQVTELSLIHI